MQGSVGLACPDTTRHIVLDTHNVYSSLSTSLSSSPSVCCIQLTTVDQQTAVVGKEPLETLHTFRTGLGLGWAAAGGVPPVHVDTQCGRPRGFPGSSTLSVQVLNIKPGQRCDSCRPQVVEARGVLWEQPGDTAELGDGDSWRRCPGHHAARHIAGWRPGLEGPYEVMAQATFCWCWKGTTDFCDQ